MFFEICLIQKFTLFLGYPSYSLTVTLFALLVFSGIGSLVSERYAGHRGLALCLLLLSIMALSGFYQIGMPWVVDRFIALPLGARILMATGLLAPLGICLGAFMPIGLKTVAALGPHGSEYVAWGWAVNGFFSVTASSLATICSMGLGFRVVLALAVVFYAIGIIAISRVPAPRPQ
jgi:MFS family permease